MSLLPKKTKVPWNPKDERTLLQLRAEGKTFMQIAKLMGRTAAACDGRWHKIKRETDQKGDRSLPGLDRL